MKLNFKSKKAQQLSIIISIICLFFLATCVKPFATDGYETVTSKKALANKVATAVAENQPELYIDYTGEDYSSLKDWFKSYFKYDNLVTVGGEYAAYNYNGAKFTYWSYSDKKRVKVTISYKETVSQKAEVDAYVSSVINKLGLRNMDDYTAIKTTHDYLIDNFKYKSGANALHTVIQNKTANCYGYTMLNYLILDKLGIDCRTTIGSVNDSHIWNAVKLNGQWYYVDVTWDTVGNKNSYLLISTSQIKKTHKILGNFIPNCPSNYVAPATEEKQPEKVEGKPTISATPSIDSEKTDNTTTKKEEIVTTPSPAPVITPAPSAPAVTEAPQTTVTPEATVKPTVEPTVEPTETPVSADEPTAPALVKTITLIIARFLSLFKM